MTALLGACALSGCGGPQAPPHPVGGMASHNASRIEVVDLIIDDPLRADRVKATYLEIWKLGEAFDRERARVLMEQAQLAGQKDATVTELRDALLAVREAGRDAMARYVFLIGKVRANTTAEEFERLEAFH